jgi:hypothetical protein
MLPDSVTGVFIMRCIREYLSSFDNVDESIDSALINSRLKEFLTLIAIRYRVSISAVVVNYWTGHLVSHSLAMNRLLPSTDRADSLGEADNTSEDAPEVFAELSLFERHSSSAEASEELSDLSMHVPEQTTVKVLPTENACGLSQWTTATLKAKIEERFKEITPFTPMARLLVQWSLIALANKPADTKPDNLKNFHWPSITAIHCLMPLGMTLTLSQKPLIGSRACMRKLLTILAIVTKGRYPAFSVSFITILRKHRVSQK